MNEQEWLVSTDPAAMLAHVDPSGPPRTSLRKLRLFAAACLRLDGLEKTAAALEQFADDGDELALLKVWKLGRLPIAFGTVAGTRIYAADLAKIGPQASRAQVLRCIFNPFRPVTFGWKTVRAAAHMSAAALESGASEEQVWFGDWTPTPTVLAVARGIYERHAWDEMPILSDALDEAGCTDEAILQHLRGWVRCPACLGTRLKSHEEEGPFGRGTVTETCHDCQGGWVRPRCPAVHARGCHVLDAILGRP